MDKQHCERIAPRLLQLCQELWLASVRAGSVSPYCESDPILVSTSDSVGVVPRPKKSPIQQANAQIFSIKLNFVCVCAERDRAEAVHAI